MRVLFNIAFLAFFIIQIELNLSTFQRQIFREEKWPQTVYKELSFKVDSKLECAALCEVESKSCVGIIWIDSVCYLTDPMSQFSEISSPQTKDQSMYINQEIISSILSVFLHLIDPIVNHWMARVYASIPTTSMFDCNVECATDFNCQLYVKEGSLCHLGNGTFFNSSIQIKEIPTEGVYVDTGFTIEAGPMVFLNDSSSTWMHHIYYSSICDLRERCELWCFLERSPCQFMVYTGSICYLGSTEQESQMVNNSSMAPTQKVWLTKKGIENTNYEIAFERNIYSTNYAPFIIKSYNADDFLQSCDFFCAFQTEPACHFFFLTGGICYLGNMDGTHPSIENSASLETIHIHLPVSNASLLEFYSIPMHHHTWRIRMHTQIITNSTIGACALRCLIMDLQKECSLFVYDESICYLGATSHYEYAQTIDDIFNVYIAKSLALYLQRYFKSRLTSDWASQMYKKVVLYYPTPQNADECLLRCHFDDGPCHSFVVHENECYLGDPFVNSSLFFGTENALIMEKNTQLYLSHGGSKGDGDEKTSSIFEGCNGQCNHSLLDLPYPLRAMGYAYGEDSIFVCGGTSDVNGGEQDKCYQWRFKVFPRAWIPLPAMMNNQMMFPMFYHQGKLYAAGGRSSGSTIGNMRFLDLNSTSWTNGGAYENTGYYAHCGILYQDRIYTFGGSRNSLLFSSSVQVYDTAADSWSYTNFRLPQGLRHMACGLIPGNGGLVPDLFLIAGGESDLGEYSNKVYSVDPNSDVEMKEILELSMTVSHFGSQNSFAVLNVYDVFLAIGFGNGAHKTDTVLKWNHWTPSLDSYSIKLPGFKQPGNVMIPLRNIPICTNLSQMWKPIVNHVKPARFPVGGWNEKIEDNGRFSTSQFQLIEQNRCDGKYHFRLTYPELGTYNEWYQTNDPSNSSHIVVTGFQGLALGMPNGFYGLLFNNVDALAMGDSNTSDPQWFSVGRIKPDTVSGEIPGPPNTFVSEVQLFIRDDCAAT